MTREVLTVPPEMRIAEVAGLMLGTGHHRLIVVDAGRAPLGIISRNALRAAQQGEPDGAAFDAQDSLTISQGSLQ